ncbi:MAG: patatin-like phospholipase family protein [Acidobacteriota bacterium]
MKRTVTLVCFLAVVPCLGYDGWTQPHPKPTRSRVGLVLEGGGALGFAHIGVLEFLEEHQIPVDVIAGTSMGGLMGGLYASGMSTAEIRDLIRSADWDLILSGETPFADLAFRRKEDRITYPNRIEFGLRGGLTVPVGLNPGHQIGLILSRATLPYPDSIDFDDLPTPFRCVAVELISGKETVYSRGSLAEALRATMSLPAVFTPVRKEGRIYTDGGLLNNLPVNVVKQMGADIVIAVHLSTGPVDPEKLRSLFGILDRSIAVMVSANEFRNMQLADILITVNLEGFSSLDYQAGQSIADKGYAAAGNKQGILAHLELDQATWTEHMQRRAGRRRRGMPVPSFVDVRGMEPRLTQSVKRSLTPWLNRPLEPASLEKTLTRFTGLGRFASLGYGTIERQGRQGLLVQADERDHGPPFFKPAIELDGRTPGDVRFTLSGRVTFLDVGGFRSEWRNDLRLGARYGLSTEYYRPLGPVTNWFVAPRLQIIDEPFDVFQAGTRSAEFRVRRAGIGVDLGYNFNRFAEFRIGHTLGWVSERQRTGELQFQNIPEKRADFSSIGFAYEGQDDAVIPRRGIRIASNLSFFPRRASPPGRYLRSRLEVSEFIPISAPASLFFGASGGTITPSRDLGLRGFSLGGPLQLGAYAVNELIGNQFFLFTTGYLREVFALSPFLGDKLYASSFLQIGKMYGNQDYPDVNASLSGALILKSAFGPIFLGASLGDQGKRRWYFGLGRWF